MLNIKWLYRTAVLALMALSFFAGTNFSTSSAPKAAAIATLHQQLTAAQSHEIAALRGLRQEAKNYNWTMTQMAPGSTLPAHPTVANTAWPDTAAATVNADSMSCDDMIAFYNALAHSLSRSVLLNANLPQRLSFASSCQAGGKAHYAAALGITYARFAQ